jgi:hypothetical protein
MERTPGKPDPSRSNARLHLSDQNRAAPRRKPEVSSLALPRGVAWLTALFGSTFYSERAMRLLRRPPVGGSSAAPNSGGTTPATRAAIQRRQHQP